MNKKSGVSLVTGGAGFIGSEICRQLVAERESVLVLDNLSGGTRKNLEGIEVQFIEGDVRDQSLVKQLFREQQISVVYHLAAFISVPDSLQHPEECYAINVDGSKNLIEAARNHGCSRFVFSSSCAVYGDEPGFPKTESSRTKPISPYAASKQIIEQELLSSVNRVIGPTVLRYFNVFGVGQDPRSEYAAVIAKFCDQVRQGKPVFINGDGSVSRDFVYVTDVARANLHLANHPQGYGLFQVASGQETTILQLAQMIQKLIEDRVSIEFRSERSGDLHRSCADTAKIRATGWEPQVDLRNGLRSLFQSLGIGMKQDG